MPSKITFTYQLCETSIEVGRRGASHPSFTGNSERVVEPSSAIYSLLAARYGGAL